MTNYVCMYVGTAFASKVVFLRRMRKNNYEEDNDANEVAVV